MDDLRYTLGAMGGGKFRREFGRAYFDGSKWWAEVHGNLLDARWADPIMPAQGSTIVVDIASDGDGQASAFVSSMYTTQPRPSTATVAAIGVTELVLLGANGSGGYTTDRFLGAIEDYTIGDAVRLRWSEGKPMVLDIISSVFVPAPQDPPEQQSGPPTGYEVLIATASDTFWGPGGWGSYATSRNGGEDLYTGTYNGQTVTGAWFYGAARPVLQGKTITKILFRVPGRILSAGTRAAVTLDLYAHTANARPGGDVNRVAGAHTITIPAGYNPSIVLEAGSPPGYVQLPLSFAQALAGGGGISIAGGPYSAYNSRLDDPESGKTILDWKA